MGKRSANNQAVDTSSSTERFSSIGFIASAIGSAIGLGNLWKFPYITGKYGGGAFLFVFILSLIFVGMPILLAELAIGRGGRGNASSSYLKLSGSKFWANFGFLSILASFLIMCFYSVVAGWTIYYTWTSFTGALYKSTDFTAHFAQFTGGYAPLFWQFIALLICMLIILRGVSSGIEKFNKLLIPTLAIVLIILMVRSLMLPGAVEGVEFFLKTDFSMLTGESLLVALGQAFFSLSLGMGAMITFGSYVGKEQSLINATLAVSGGNILYALISGLIIFPATFTYDIPAGQGPGLVFAALPAAFAAMPFGAIFGGLFFALLTMAALTSAVSLLEVNAAFAMSKWKWSRAKATCIITLVIYLVSIPTALSVGGLLGDLKLWGKNLFDLMDYFASNLLLPLSGLASTIFVGYVWNQAAKESGLGPMLQGRWIFLLRYITPILVILVLLYSTGLLNMFFSFE
jgi:neurotransmitter:Na+ symporter, NSS family